MATNISPVYQDEFYYQNYMKQLSGKWDKEKEEFVNEEIEHFSQLDNTLAIAQARFSDGEISEQELSTTARFVADSKVSYDGFEKLLDQVELMKQRSPQEQVLVYESGYELLLGKSYFGLSNELMQTSIFISSLIILLVPFMAEEYESDMINTIKTTRNGRRKLLTIKMALGLFLTIVMFLISFIPTIIAINASYPLGQLHAAIKQFPPFRTYYQSSLLALVGIWL